MTAANNVAITAVRVLFADVEGQGDRDAAYDARLASAILPLTKCVIFNWRDSLQVDRMLNLLGVMQRAAHNVDLGTCSCRPSMLLLLLLLLLSIAVIVVAGIRSLYGRGYCFCTCCCFGGCFHRLMLTKMPP